MSIDHVRLRLLVPLLAVLGIAFASTAAHAQPGCPNAKHHRVQYKVKIDSAPPGATIYIDSKSCPSIGQTPWSGKLNSGSLTVIIEKPAYKTTTRVFRVARLRRVQELFVPLEAQPRIEVNASADKNLVGATISVDGVSAGKSNAMSICAPSM